MSMNRAHRRYALVCTLLMMGYCLFKLLDDDNDAAAAAAVAAIRLSLPPDVTRSAGVRSPQHEKATLPQQQQQHDDDHHLDHHDDISYDLQAITDPVLELDALDGMMQIHHGIYKVQAMLRNGGKLQFAFKTECRRASKWHGQQGWSEVAVYHFTRLFYEQRDTPQFATAPAARGVFVSISQAQLDTVVHRDRCGVVSDGLLAHVPVSAKGMKQLKQRLSGGAVGGSKRYLLVGVALTWQPSHNDNALPGNDIRGYFSPPPAGGASPPLSKRVREIVSQISDVQAMDYLLINDDREEKNWFKDHSGRFVMMDNGWAFAGRGYEGSVCGVDAALLTCPPLFRHVMGGAKKCATGTIVNCRFRAETVQTLFEAIGLADGIQSFGQFAQPSFKPALVAQAFASKALADWQHAVLQDPLLQFLDAAYGPQEITNKHKPFSIALERFVQGCAAMPGDLIGEASTVVAAAPGGGSNGSLVRWMRYGLAVRMVALAEHVAACAASHGEAYVCGAPLTPRPAEPSASSA